MTATATPTLDGALQRSREVLATLGERLAATAPPAVATVAAVGSLGRRELLPTSDLDLVVVLHDEAASDPAVAADAYRAVWAVAETLGYERPEPRGIFAEPTSGAALDDRTQRGVIEESPVVFGKRIQLLLEGREVLHAASFAALRDRILGWYGFDEVQPAPFAAWSHLLHDLGRYRHSLAVRYQWLHRDDPPTWRKLVVKSRFSRVLNQAGLLALLGGCSTAPRPFDHLRERLPLTPLERLATVAGGDDALAHVVTGYERFLAVMADPVRRAELSDPDSTACADLLAVGERLQHDVARLLERGSIGWAPALRTALFA